MRAKALISALLVAATLLAFFEVREHGFVDYDDSKVGTVIQGVKGLGTTRQIPELVRRYGIDHVILTTVEASPGDVRRTPYISTREPEPVLMLSGPYTALPGPFAIPPPRSC